MSLGITTRILGRFSESRMKAMRTKLLSHVSSGMFAVVADAEKQLKTDYLQRGGTFTRTKRKGKSSGAGRPQKTRTTGYAWVKNPTLLLRVGSGDLKRSWRARRPQWNGSTIEGRLTSSSRYARIHEYGGETGARGKRFTLPARPYLKPMIKDNRENWSRMLGKELKTSLD